MNLTINPSTGLPVQTFPETAPMGLGEYAPPSLPEFEPTELEKQTMWLFLEIGKPGTRRKVSADDVEVETDKAMLHVSKDILDSKELAAISVLDGAARRDIVAIAVPSTTLKGGIYRIKLQAVMKVRALLTEYATKREEAIDLFIAAYPSLIKDAEARLQDLFDVSDYPSSKELRADFRVRWSFKAVGVDVKLKGISEELFHEEQEKAKKELAGELESIKLALQSQMLVLVSELDNAIQPGDDGKPKRFNKARVEKLTEFAKNLADRDPINDPKIKDLAAQALAALEGIDAQVLRDSKETRTFITGVMGNLKSDLTKLTENAPKRMFAGDDF